MIKKVCAITVSQNYLERKKYSIKLLSVGKRITRTPFWFVQHTGETDTDRDMLEDKALWYSTANLVPYIVDVRHGDNVTKNHKEILKKYGVSV